MSTRVATGLLDRRRSIVQARHRRRRTMLLAALAAAATVVGGRWVATGPLLEVSRIEIWGYRQPDQARVVETIRIAARHGTMLRLPTVAVRKALAPYPWVAGVTLHHNWLRGIDVEITQASPAAIAVTDDGARLAVSDTGRVLGEASGELAALPRYRVPAARIGAQLRGPAQRAPFAFLTAMAPASASKVRDLRFQGGVLIGRLAGGPELRVGPARLLWEKARALEALLQDRKVAEPLSKAAYLDLSAPTQPTLGGIPQTTGAASEGSTKGSPSASPSGEPQP